MRIDGKNLFESDFVDAGWIVDASGRMEIDVVAECSFGCGDTVVFVISDAYGIVEDVRFDLVESVCFVVDFVGAGIGSCAADGIAVVLEKNPFFEKYGFA